MENLDGLEMTNYTNIKEDIEYRKRFASSEKDVLKHIQKIHISKENEITKQRFLVEIRNKMDKAEEELSDCLKTEKIMSTCYSDYGSRMSNLKNIIENTKDIGKLKSFYLPCIPELVDEDTQKMINNINNISKERTSYGLREEITDKKSIILAWSDASKAWYPYSKSQKDIKTEKEIYSHIAKRGMKIKLDANQILVPTNITKVPMNITKVPMNITNVPDDKDLDKLGHAASCSNPLPLYKLSFEAIYERKETPFLPGLFTWLERQTARLKEKEERAKHV